MINTYPSDHKQQGAVTFIITTILIFLITLLIIFAAGYNIMQQKTVSNEYRAAQAYLSAEAGLDFGLAYFQVNSSTILSNPISGFIQPFTNSLVTNVSLLSGGKFSVTFANPTANNYNLITITSSGTSNDSTTTRSISQRIVFGSLLTKAPTGPLLSKGSVSMSGNGAVTNLFGNNTIQSAQSVTLSGSSQTVLATGIGSIASLLGSDISQNNTTLANTSQNDLFSTYFGAPAAQIKSNVSNYYNNSANTNYSSTLNGLSGTSIWIDQTGGTATINGNTTIGTVTSPVLLVVNGNLSMSGNVTIHGFIFVTGTSGISASLGNITIDGALMTTNNLVVSGSSFITYNPTLLSSLRNQAGMKYYARLPGSWKDF